MPKVTLAEVLPANRKLTDAQVLEIRSLYSQGAAKAKLAKAYGVSRPTIRSIVKRETWAHLEER